MTPQPLRVANKELESVRRQKDQAIADQKYEVAAQLRDTELKQVTVVEELNRER